MEVQNKKECTMCGCIMINHESDLCECCLDDLAEIDSTEVVDC